MLSLVFGDSCMFEDSHCTPFPPHPLPKKKYIQILKQNKTSNYKPTFFKRVLERLKNEVFLSFFLHNDSYLHSPYKSLKKAVWCL